MKNGLQEGVYGCGWVGVISETDQLWMVRVAASATEKNGLGEESLSPKGHEPGWVEVFWVDGPEAHWLRDVTLRAIRGGRRVGPWLTWRLTGERSESG